MSFVSVFSSATTFSKSSLISSSDKAVIAGTNKLVTNATTPAPNNFEADSYCLLSSSFFFSLLENENKPKRI